MAHNRFCFLGQRPAAIVTPIEGTTRDILEVTLNIGGYPLVLADTAGLRAKATDIVEKEGINRALQLYEKSDLIILVFNLEKYIKWKNKFSNKTQTDYIVEYIENLKLSNLVNVKVDGHKVDVVFNKPCIMVFNKSDLSDDINVVNSENCVSVSCVTEDGISNLIENISNHLKEL